MSLQALTEVGPTNGVILLVALVVALVVAGRSITQLRNAEEPSVMALFGILAAPLAFIVYAVTLQYAGGELAGIESAPAAAKQTLLAMALSRAAMTQVVGGVVVCIPALLIIAGCLSVAQPGERPRMRIAGAAALLTIALTATALGSGAASGAWGLAAVRSMIYLTAGLGTTAALLTTHHRGPGAQVGPMAATVLPLLVAGLDATASGWHSVDQFRLIAQALPADRQAILFQMSQTIDTLRWFSAASLLIAVALAGLGPAASAYQSRPLVRSQTAAVVLSMLTAGLVVIFGGNYLLPFFAVAP